MTSVEVDQTRPARRRLAPAARREQLLAAAEEVFARRGYQGTAVDDVATAAGVSRALIYTYFADLDEVYLQCVQQARTELEQSFTTAALSESEPELRLRAGLGAYFAFVQDRGQRWDILFGAGAAVAGPHAKQVADLRFATAEKIAVLLQASRPHLDEELAYAAAHAVSGAAEQVAKWWRTRPDVSRDRVVDHLMSVVWAGLVTT